MADPAQDLNETIAAAVQARIETEVAAALAGSEFLGQMVASVLHQKIKVEDRHQRYGHRETTFLRETLDRTIETAVKAAVVQAIADEAPAIEAAVTTELRKQVKPLAGVLVDGLKEKADNNYGLRVELRYGDA